MGTCKPRGMELAPGPHPTVGWDQPPAQGLTTALPQLSTSAHIHAQEKALVHTHSQVCGDPQEFLSVASMALGEGQLAP